MKLVWQTEEHWWGMHCIAQHEDYKLSVMWMRDAGSSICRIDEGYRVRYKSTLVGHPAPEAQLIIEKKLRRMLLRERFNWLLGRKKHVVAAA
jgi:hypothetical protein